MIERFRRILACGAALCALVASPVALGQHDCPTEFSCACVHGDCRDGRGTKTVRYGSYWLKGTWAGGGIVPDSDYLLSAPIAGAREYPQRYGADGLLSRGSMLFGPTTGKPSVFTGSFSRFEHPYLRRTVAVPDEGQYLLPSGIEFHGRFSFIPSMGNAGKESPQRGYYLLIGKRIDREEDEVSEGLFVSDDTVGHIVFTPARADYVARLHRHYQAERAVAEDRLRKEDEILIRNAIWEAVLGGIYETVVMGGANSLFSKRNALVKDVILELMAQKGDQPIDLNALVTKVAARSLLGSDASSRAENARLVGTLLEGINKGRGSR